MNTRIKKLDSSSIDVSAEVLRAGKVAIIPTDTIYGFSGLVPQTESLIRSIKGRAETKPFIQLIGSPSDISLYTDDILPAALKNLWPGAVTIIVNDKKGGTTGFRCPDDPWLCAVVQKAGGAVYSTSVNLAGQEFLWKIEDIARVFGEKADLLVDDGDRPGGIASTIVGFTDGTCRIIRQGGVQVSPDLLCK